MSSLTEAEAKMKWCPFVRVGIYSGQSAVAVNRDPRDDIKESQRCVASSCMMWRWDADDGGGYCGMAGKGAP